MRYKLLFTALTISLVLSFSNVMDSEARQLRTISAPAKIKMKLPDGAIPVDEARDLDRRQISAAVEQVVSLWNQGDTASTLSERFFDKSRLSDAIDSLVPRDATLRIQSVQGVRTLEQYLLPSSKGNRLVSVVSATVRTQLEFNDPSTGFVQRQGVNEFILQISQPAQR
ncbi:MAG: hypothetical protein GKR93_09120 [Gammaproteobacteria bacterium]|nr:hypothetical protein [Gammaproteobacteria bacterium]